MKILVIILSLISLTSLIPLISNNFVSEVVDGDTFSLKGGARVRLLGVDVPEFDRCFGTEAKKRLTELILNKPVILKEEKPEKYGRKMALVYLLDGTLINKTMMEEGFGRPDYRDNSQREVLTTAFHEAKNNNLGLWNSCIISPNSPIPPKCSIKGNIDSGTFEKFYHLPNCPHYNQTSLNLSFGDAWFCTEKEAAAAGFTKSRTCP